MQPENCYYKRMTAPSSSESWNGELPCPKNDFEHRSPADMVIGIKSTNLSTCGNNLRAGMPISKHAICRFEAEVLSALSWHSTHQSPRNTVHQHAVAFDVDNYSS